LVEAGHVTGDGAATMAVIVMCGVVECSFYIQKSNMAVYAVIVGRRAGVYLQREDCEAVVDCYSGAVHHKWQTLREATQCMNKAGYRHDEIIIHSGVASIPLAQYCDRQLQLVPAEVSCEHRSLFDLGRGLHVEACLYQGTQRIDVRVWDDEGKRTKRGISLTIEQWVALLEDADKLDADLDRVKSGEGLHSSYCLGESVFVSITSPYRVLHIRRWYTDNGELKPGRQGITLRIPEWRHLVDLQEQLAHAHRELATTTDG
jgi:hypothetical protein